LKTEKIAILYLTRGGGRLASRLTPLLPQSTVYPCKGTLRQTIVSCWQEYDHLVCIMATGIVVRMIAPLLADKRTDPSVIVCDEKGRFAISLLSGHIGGGNGLAEKIAAGVGGQAVITTASDVLGHTALDLWAEELGLVVADKPAFTKVMGKLVNTGRITLYAGFPLPPLPADIVRVDHPEKADLVISCRSKKYLGAVLLNPRALVAGMGCNRHTPAEEFDVALAEACSEHGLALQSVRSLASIDLKSDEAGLLEFAKTRGYHIDFYDRDQLNGVDGVSTSAAVLKATGAKGVAEPAAVLAAGGGRLLVKKMKWKNVTVAIAEISNPLSVSPNEPAL